MLRNHIEREGVAEDERHFRSRGGGYVHESAYGLPWPAARRVVPTPSQVASPLAARPYDLRHASVTLCLNSGVPAAEVALRAGHGVGVLLKVYAGCIDGDDDAVNARITKALPASHKRGDGRRTNR